MDIAGESAGLTRTAAILSGALLIGFALIQIAILLGGTKLGKLLRPPAALANISAKLQGKAMRFPAPVRAGLIGLLTPLLPCGWLYAFVFAAAGTGTILGGGLLMAAFWLGTIPLLAAIGATARLSLQKLGLGRTLQAAMALIVLATGIWMTLTRSTLDTTAWHTHLTEQAEQGESTTAGDTPPPCCAE